MIKMVWTFKQRLKNTNNPFIITIVKHASKYLGGSLIAAVVGVLMNKYYTHVFSPAEFGVLSLYLALGQYLQNLLAFTVDSSSQRVYFEYKGSERGAFLGTTLIFMVCSTVFWLGIYFMTQDMIVSYLGGDSILYWLTFGMAIAIIYVNFVNRISYNENLSGVVLKQGLIQSFINHFISYVLISFAKWGMVGRQAGQLIAGLVNVYFYTMYLKKLGLLNIVWTFRMDILKRLRYFAQPSFFTTVLAATFSYVDRVFLQYYHGPQEVGIYTFGFVIGQGMSMIVEAASMALFPSVMRELEQDYETSIKRLKKIDVIFCSSLMLIAIFIFLFRDWIILILSNKNYQNAGNVLPFIVMGYVLGGFYKNVSSVLAFHNHVWFYPLVAFVSYGSTALLNYLLIPQYHEMGASYAFFIGLFIYSFLVQWIGSKYYVSKRKIICVYMAILLIMSLLFVSKIG